MDYIAQNKLRIHLEIGFQLAQFIKTSRYFESITFDWVLPSGTEEQASIRIIRSLNEDDEYHCDCDRFCKLGNL